MVRTELIERSPLRILERSTSGGPAVGEVAVIASRKGVGKTACLVHIATDQLFQKHHVIHVSFAARTDHIVNWYEDIFREIARKRNLENALTEHASLIQNRVIMNFSQQGTRPQQVLRSLRAMIEQGSFNADLLVVDGFDFEQATADDLAQYRSLAGELGLALWFSATTHRDKPAVDANGVPIQLVRFLPHIDILIGLTPQPDHIALRLIKDHDLYPQHDLDLKLDQSTLLIARQ